MKAKYLLIAFCFVITSQSCKKYLDLKPDKSLVIPETTDDLQALLDNPIMYSYAPVMGQSGSDDYYLLDASFNQVALFYRQMYNWDPAGQWDNDYVAPYKNILSTNLVLDYLDKVANPNGNGINKNILKGEAYLNRAFNLFQLTQVFTLPYNPATASTQMGLPIKTTSDINSSTTRASLKATFEQIIGDYKMAATLLPVDLAPLTRGNKAAAFAGLAQTLLVMGDYKQAGDYADSCLALKSTLIDYNNLDAGAANPIAKYNVEVLLHNNFGGNLLFFKIYYKVDSTLYKSYTTEDLRKGIFYGNNPDGSHYFKGGYDGNLTLLSFFSGLATDEVYLIKAECEARVGTPSKAMQYLNTLRQNRINKQDYAPLAAATGDQALDLILDERRKELAFRGARWMDLRRLSLDSRLAQTISRTIGGQVFSLAPGDPRYAFLLPQSVVKLSGIAQNAR